jgi:hypothetical protein
MLTHVIPLVNINSALLEISRTTAPNWKPFAQVGSGVGEGVGVMVGVEVGVMVGVEVGEGVSVGVAEGGTGVEVGNGFGVSVAVGVLQPQSNTKRHMQIISLRNILF